MRNKILIAISIISLSLFVFSFTTKTATPNYEYLQITFNNKYLAISTSNNYTETNVSDSKKGRYDSSEALKTIENYQTQGYEIINHTLAIGPTAELTFNYLLRKVK